MATSRRPTPKPPVELEPEASVVVEKPEEAVAETPNGVIVIRTTDDSGNQNFDVQVLGDVRITEADTILALGRKRLQQSLGI